MIALAIGAGSGRTGNHTDGDAWAILAPIFIPLLPHFNIDPLFFGLLVALNLQTAFLSPPVAMAPFFHAYGFLLKLGGDVPGAGLRAARHARPCAARDRQMTWALR